jgi:hypothetical protein
MNGCHNAARRGSGYQLTDYANIIQKGIFKGNASKSDLYISITSGSMPQRGSGIVLSQSQKDLIATWINKGANNYVCNGDLGQCDSATVSFSGFVKPLIENRCQGCHIGSYAGAGISLTNYNEIKTAATSARFIGSLKGLSGYFFMPKDGQTLTNCEIGKMSEWIRKGEPNN